MDNETRELVLANRLFLWSLIARGYAEEADGVFLTALQDDQARVHVALVDDEWSDGLSLALEALVEFAAADDAEAMARDHFTRVFVGPGTLAASPWEAMHLSGRRVLFQPDVLDVREAYRRAGFLPERYRQVSDDAIGLECDFIAKLAQRAAEANAEGEGERRDEALRQSCAFLDDHLLRWIGSLAQAVEVHYGADNFYALFTRFTELWCRRDRALLDALLAASPDESAI